jgi:hypothetical protein
VAQAARVLRRCSDDELQDLDAEMLEGFQRVYTTDPFGNMLE